MVKSQLNIFSFEKRGHCLASLVLWAILWGYKHRHISTFITFVNMYWIGGAPIHKTCTTCSEDEKWNSAASSHFAQFFFTKRIGNLESHPGRSTTLLKNISTVVDRRVRQKSPFHADSVTSPLLNSSKHPLISMLQWEVMNSFISFFCISQRLFK